MKAPECRICGAVHWGREPHKWVANTPTLATKPVVANKEMVANTKEVVANSESPKSRHGVYADKERRKAYMRDLMKKRRQK